jgi:hypothetical protein
MNTEQQIKNAIEEFVKHCPQPNLEAESAQVALTHYIYKSLEGVTVGTYNRDQLNFFTAFDGEEHK